MEALKIKAGILLVFMCSMVSAQSSDSTSMQVYYQKINAQFREGNHLGLEEVCRQSKQAALLDGDTIIYKRICLLEGDKLAKMDSLRRAIEGYRSTNRFDQYDRYSIKAHRKMADLFLEINEVDSAKTHMKIVTQLNQEVDSKERLLMLFSKAMIESKTDNFDEASSLYLAFLQDTTYLPHLPKSLQTFYESSAYLRLGRLFNMHRSKERAQYYFDQALEYIPQMNKRQKIKAYRIIGLFYLENDEVDKAYETFEKATKHFTKRSNPYSWVQSYAMLASIQLNKNDIKKGDSLLQIAAERLSEIRQGPASDKYYLALSKSHFLHNRIAQSKAALNKANAGNMAFKGAEVLDLRKDIALAEKDYQAAFYYQTEANSIRDSLFDLKNNAILFELENKYNKASQELKISALDHKNQLQRQHIQSQSQKLLGLGIVFALLSALSFWIYRLYKTKKQQNKVIAKALSDKELLLREIHHRVKNNLQVVSSLLGLQSEYIRDDAALSAINEGRNRVQSMALIHQNLYTEDHLTGIHIKTYFDKLVSGLFHTYNINAENIQLRMEIEDLILDVDTVVPLGLITNELVSNALKHAFTEQKSGYISVRLGEESDKLLLVVEDNGKGMDPNSIHEDISSFGYQMILAFKEKLEAELIIENQGGTKVVLEINEFQKT